ncbi:MAG: A24 family peptidase [Lachnospiraceae bacterium]|nr:A24 family peptidase [Lachnospiraceae bacterium]
MEARLIVLLGLCLLAAIMDIYSYKVKNHLIIVGVLAGNIFFIHSYGIQGLLYSMLGLCIPLLSMAVFYRFRLFGAGDLKLFAMIGAITGPKDIAIIMAASFVLGAVIGAVKIVFFDKSTGLHKIRFAVPTFLGVASYVFGIIPDIIL